MESLQRWSLIAEIVGGVAVVLSIVYLAFEINSNTNAIYSQTNQGLIEMWIGMSSPIVNDEEMADIFLKAKNNFESLSESESYRYRIINDGIVGIWEQAYYSNQNGTLDDELWSGWDRSFTNWVCLDANPLVWGAIRDNYVGDFALHGDQVVAACCPQ